MQQIATICLELATTLLHNQYQMGNYTRFAIVDPKLREIYAPEFKDRLAQSWLVKQIEPIIENALIEDTFANRKNKGTLKALDRVQSFMRKPDSHYYLQLDIQNFFNSIHRPTLLTRWLTLLEQHKNSATRYSQQRYQLITQLSQTLLTKNITQNPYTVSGCRKLLSSVPYHKQLSSSPSDTGLPIGAITSQLFANLYLSSLDHFAKHTLKIKKYTRYMDDIFIVADNPTTLNQWKNEIVNFLQQLKLNLHPTKQHLNLCRHGADYLGYKIYPHYRHLRTRNIKKLMQWLRFFNQIAHQQVPNNPPNSEYWQHRAKQPRPINYTDLQKIQAIINSYFALLSKGNHYQLRKTLYHHHFDALTHWLIPKNRHYTSVKIKKWVMFTAINQLTKIE